MWRILSWVDSVRQEIFIWFEINSCCWTYVWIVWQETKSRKSGYDWQDEKMKFIKEI